MKEDEGDKGRYPLAVGAGTPIAVGAGRSDLVELAVDAGSPMMTKRRSSEMPEEAGKNDAIQMERLAPSLKIGALVTQRCRLPLGDGSGGHNLHCGKVLRDTKNVQTKSGWAGPENKNKN